MGLHEVALKQSALLSDMDLARMAVDPDAKSDLFERAFVFRTGRSPDTVLIVEWEAMERVLAPRLLHPKVVQEMVRIRAERKPKRSRK